jgi:hypothetical protein
MDRCPICDVAVKPENLIRHLDDIHPRHPDTPGLREKLKEEPGRVVRRPTGRPLRVRRWQVLLVVVIMIGGLGTYAAVQALTPSRPFGCITREGGTLYHWHTHLSISQGSEAVAIPSGIGLEFGCTHPIHTHDGTGELHIESDSLRLYSIGDFFQIWKRPWGNPILMHVNDTELAPNPGQILWDNERLHIQY